MDELLEYERELLDKLLKHAEQGERLIVEIQLLRRKILEESEHHAMAPLVGPLPR